MDIYMSQNWWAWGQTCNQSSFPREIPSHTKPKKNQYGNLLISTRLVACSFQLCGQLTPNSWSHCIRLDVCPLYIIESFMGRPCFVVGRIYKSSLSILGFWGLQYNKCPDNIMDLVSEWLSNQGLANSSSWGLENRTKRAQNPHIIHFGSHARFFRRFFIHHKTSQVRGHVKEEQAVVGSYDHSFA